MAVNWFRRKRGRALGAVSMAIPLGGAALVPVARAISDALSWEAVYLIFAAMMHLMLRPVVLVLRRRPEDIGLLPDGDSARAAAPGGAAPASAAVEGHQWTLRQASRTPAFWMLIAATTCGTFGNGGIGFHQAAYFTDQGIAAASIALAISAYALFGALSNGLWGFLVEHISERLLGTMTLLLASLLPLYLLTVDSAPEAVLFAVLLGLLARGEGSIIVMIQAQYFGRHSFGAIAGISTPFQQVALGLGPIVAALIYELTDNSYTIAFLLFAVMFAPAAVLIWAPASPCRRQPEAPAYASLMAEAGG